MTLSSGRDAALENAVPTAAQTGGAGLHRGSAPDGSATPRPGGRPAALPDVYKRQGCGKSTVTAVFAARGIPLADADQLSREILLPGSPLLPQLAERFGADIIKEDGTLDRRLLAVRAFATPEGTAALDAPTHPEIVRRIRAAKQAAQQAGAKLFVLDGAVIIGTAAEAECDKLCVVTAPFEVSVERIAARDGISPEMAARRLNAQTPEAVLTARADSVSYTHLDVYKRQPQDRPVHGLSCLRPVQSGR